MPSAHPNPASSPAFALVIGGGNMAQAILNGAARQGLPATFIVVEPDAAKHELLPNSCVTLAEGFAKLQALESAPGTGQIMLATKPQIFPAVAAELAPLLQQEVDAHARIVVSILAGLTSAKLRAALGGSPRIIRTMPNTPAQLGLGMSAVALGAGSQPGDDAFAKALLGACGEIIELPEDLIDAFTAAAGSGPAYVFYLAQAMTQAAESLGLNPTQADAIVRQTLLGSAHLLTESPELTASELRARVTSKKGTTQAATDVFDERDLLGTVQAALTAARDRGQSLAAES